MLKNNKKFNKGFSIIEVVLVLAIAGLIFLMVFIALPALQSSQRNTQRKGDVERIVAAVTEYGSSNRGRIPFTSTGVDSNFVKRYIDETCSYVTTSKTYNCTADQFRDPDGTTYNFAAATVSSGKVSNLPTKPDHVMYYAIGYSCGASEGTVTTGTGDRQVAVLMTLEGGGIACNANS